MKEVSSVLKRVKGCTSRRTLPVQHFVKYPPQASSLIGRVKKACVGEGGESEGALDDVLRYDCLAKSYL